MSESFKIGVFCSGGGSNLQALIDRQKSGDLHAEIAFVLSNNSSCKALERAKSAKIPTVHMSSKTHPEPKDFERAMIDFVQQYSIDLLVLAGYMKKIPDGLHKILPNQIINIHPALLPAFGGKGMYGMNVHKAVVQSGVRFSGPTVHFVNSNYDEGLVIDQKIVEVYPTDSAQDVADRVLKEEHQLLWKVVQGLATKEIHVVDGRVFLRK